jgi:tetratricopeptide (TPR) repeat protein
MSLLGAIIGGVAKLAGAAGQALGLRNQTQIAEAQSRAIALAQKRDSDNRQLGLQRMEFDAKMEMVRQAVRSKERDEDREYSLSLKKIEAETLIKNEKMRQAFQALEAEKQRDFTQSIEKFKAEIQIALQGDSIAFQRWKSETDREFSLALRELDALIVRQRDRQIRNDAKRDRNSPVFSVADDILKTVLNREQMPLTIFFSPPVLRYDPAHSASPQSQFPMMESTLSSALRDLFKQYSLAQRPIKFMAGEWITKNRRAEAAVNQIYVDLQEIPVIVLESEVEESFFNINIGFWNNDFDDARFETVVRKLRWQDAIAEISQRLLSQWQAEGRETTITVPNGNGKQTHPEFIRRNREEFTHYMEVLHCIHVGMVADEYFLLYAPQRQLPLLPTLLPDLLEEVNLPEEERTALIHVVIDYTNARFDGLAKIEPATIVDVRLAWAKILQELSDRYTFADQVRSAMAVWLQQRGITNSTDPVKDISSVLIPEDASFVQVLNPLLESLELPALNIAVSCFQRGLGHIEQSQWELARLDFERTISLNPHADAYFQRGYAYLKLEDYASSIKDFDQAAMLQSQRAEIYEYRGDAHQGLKNYEIAIANYNQAIHLGSSSAIGKRDTLQNWFTDEQRRQQEAEEEKRCAEEEKIIKANEFYLNGIHYYDSPNYAKALAQFEQSSLHGHSKADLAIQKILVSGTTRVDYSELHEHLKKQNWINADQTTKQLMWKAANRESAHWLSDLKNFPEEDLAIIDGLWTHHSLGHFGLTCQTKIWHEVGKDCIKFSKRIGWGVSYDNLKFDLLTAPLGHLPSGDELTGSGGYGWNNCSEFQIILDKLTSIMFSNCSLFDESLDYIDRFETSLGL